MNNFFGGEFPEISDRCFPKCIKISDSKSSTAACEAWVTPDSRGAKIWILIFGSWELVIICVRLEIG